jgi:hypothetical protein
LSHCRPKYFQINLFLSESSATLGVLGNGINSFQNELSSHLGRRSAGHLLRNSHERPASYRSHEKYRYKRDANSLRLHLMKSLHTEFHSNLIHSGLAS